ncbi:hypothetical protein RHO12_02705 [Orbus sturtevantii]|uniref:hypothetical protein n=1 Tax=Orbus sturtevantii TaxID=3074109 RepID=UPI00370CFC01
MKLIMSNLKTHKVMILAVICIVLISLLPISSLALKLNITKLTASQTLIYTIEDYIKATLIFIIAVWALFHFYKNNKSHINNFLKKHFLIIKGFGILYVAILAIVPVLKSSLAVYGQLSPYHHILIYLVVVIVFFCVFISSFDENIMQKQFRFAEISVCFFLCILGLALFFFLMQSPT